MSRWEIFPCGFASGPKGMSSSVSLGVSKVSKGKNYSESWRLKGVEKHEENAFGNLPCDMYAMRTRLMVRNVISMMGMMQAR